MRRNARVDSNQKEIVKTLRALGVSVQHLHFVGQGAPDLLCGFCNETYLLELKDGAKPPSARKLTVDEKLWHEQWRGAPVYIINSASEAVELFAGRHKNKNWKPGHSR